jgi:hypothetical protein
MGTGIGDMFDRNNKHLKEKAPLVAGQKWRLPESNWGHTDFQSVALPTELRRRGYRLINLMMFFSKIKIRLGLDTGGKVPMK